MRWIRLTENTLCYSFEDIDSIANEIRNPEFGYTDLDTCIAMLRDPKAFGATGYVPFPISSPMGPVTFHVDGWLDVVGKTQKLDPPAQRETGHRCGPRCLEARANRRMRAMGIQRRAG